MYILIIILFILFLIFSYYGVPESSHYASTQTSVVKTKDTSAESLLLSDAQKSNLMKGAEPIYLKGSSNTAFLMVHGYEGSPFSVKSAAEYFYQQGHTVIAPLLPGHGTREEDFIKTRYQDWYQAVRNIYIEERRKYRHFFILGTSTGGNLLLKLNAEFSKQNSPTGIILLAAPVTLAGFLNSVFVLKDWRILLSGLLQYLVPHLRKRPENERASQLSPWVGYRKKISIPCVHSVKLNFPKVKKGLPLIKNPALLIQARNDRTVHFENLHYIFRKIGSHDKRAFMFQIHDDITSRHLLLTHQETKDMVITRIEEFMVDVIFDIENKKTVEVKKSFWQKIVQKIFRRK